MFSFESEEESDKDINKEVGKDYGLIDKVHDAFCCKLPKSV